jgi:protein SCO1/2
MTVRKLEELDRAYERNGGPVPIVLLTLDPETDTPERLARYKQQHALPEHWHFIQGGLPATRALARYLAANPAYDDGHIDHDVQIAIFDAKGELVHAFSGWSFDVNAAIVR